MCLKRLLHLLSLQKSTERVFVYLFTCYSTLGHVSFVRFFEAAVPLRSGHTIKIKRFTKILQQRVWRAEYQVLKEWKFLRLSKSYKRLIYLWLCYLSENSNTLVRICVAVPQWEETKPLTTQHIWRCARRRGCSSQPGQEVGVWPADWDPVCPGRPKEWVLSFVFISKYCDRKEIQTELDLSVSMKCSWKPSFIDSVFTTCI